MTTASLAVEVLLNGAFWLWLLALIPAAAVTALKGRWLMFATGWLTLGIVWLVGALSPADPDSGWARRFYGEQRLARAADPERNPLPGRVAALWLGGALALLLGIGLLAARPAPIVGVGGQALQHSVGGSSLGSSPPPCRQRGDDRWRCDVFDSDFSSTVPYRVAMHRFGCWTAVPAGWVGESAPKRRSGCITVWDEIRPLDGIL